jgi:hypothetical protein
MTQRGWWCRAGPARVVTAASLGGVAMGKCGRLPSTTCVQSGGRKIDAAGGYVDGTWRMMVMALPVQGTAAFRSSTSTIAKA